MSPQATVGYGWFGSWTLLERPPAVADPEMFAVSGTGTNARRREPARRADGGHGGAPVRRVFAVLAWVNSE